MAQVKNLLVKQAAQMMGVSEQFIRVGLQTGVLPFGYAVNISGNQYTYYISPAKFTQHTGIEIEAFKYAEKEID